jgi:hypothetical protein
MDYLTNYYKNLCEQLQDKLNYLEQMIAEARRGTVMVDVDDIERDEGGDRIIVGRLASGKGAKTDRTITFYPQKEHDMDDYRNAAKIDAEPMEIRSNEIMHEPRERGRNVRGAGAKRVKKEIAQHGAELKKPMSQRGEISFDARNARRQANR